MALNLILSGLLTANLSSNANLQPNPPSHSSKEVAFHVQLTRLPKMKVGEPIIFDQEDLNIGKGYKEGVFTAPRKGIYYISVTVTASAGCFVTWYIESEGKVYAKVLADSVSNASDSATGNAVIKLRRGDKVQIKHHSNRCSIRCDKHTCPTFSGYLIS